MASPSTVVSLGFGSWGSVNLLLTLGFGIGVAVDPPDVAFVFDAVVSRSAVLAAAVAPVPVLSAADTPPAVWFLAVVGPSDPGLAGNWTLTLQ